MRGVATRGGTWLALLAAALVAACDTPITPAPPGPIGPGAIVSDLPILIGAGDIAQCNVAGANATGIRLGDFPNATVFTAGDNAYPHGTASEFERCYDPFWGPHKGRTRPVPGNHDYETPNGNAYFDYFGDRAGPRGLGYYTYTVGTWRVIALNSEINKSPGSTQMQWLENELRTNQVLCTAAIWHRPLFSSSRNGPNFDMREAYRLLFEFGADVVINGHDHVYERFRPQDMDGRATTTRGIRQFTVGTGGVELYEFRTPHPNSEVRVTAWGLLKLELLSGTYNWQFLAMDGEPIRDSGSGACH
jgi:acid phosphatase type 7